MSDLIDRQPEITKRTAETEQNVPNGELISRKDAIEVADAVWCVTGDKNVAKVWDQIKDLPSVQEHRWIPVTERLPERNGWYLISDEADAWIGFYTAFDREWSGMSGFPICTVFAWMPLPEPWKGEEDEPDK